MQGRAARGRAIFPSVVMLALLVYVVSVVPGVRSLVDLPAHWDKVFTVGVVVASSALCALRAVSDRRDRLAWAVIAGGIFSYAAGAAVWTVYLQDLDQAPYPSVADALWLGFYPLVMFGVGLMFRDRMAGSSVSMWLDGVVSGVGLASLSAATVFPRVTAGASGPPAAVVINFAYPLLDLALLITIIGGMAALGAWRDRSWLLLGAGFAAFSAADSWYLLQLADASYAPGGPVDAAFLVAVVLVALAGHAGGGAPDDGEPVNRQHSRSFLVPGLFGLVAVAVLATDHEEGSSRLGIVLATGALIAAWGRTALTVREIVQLSDARRQALTDALTGLANRRAFYEVLEAAQVEQPVAGSAGGTPSAGTVLLLDLDRFKEVNDALGHQLGDEVLCEASRRLAALVPPGGTIARLGGDELAFYVPGATPGQAGELARRLLDTFAEPFAIGGIAVHLAASVGIAAHKPGTDVARALAEADLAMYRAKSSHSGWQVYDPARDGDAWDRLATVEALRQALAEDDGISVEFQPIVAAASKRPTGFEALVRWTHPTLGRMSPDEFIPLAEQAGLMPQLTRVVLRRSLELSRDLRHRGWGTPVSVNLSAGDLLDALLVDHIADALAERGLPGSALRIEITESLAVDRGRGAAAFLDQLRALSIELAVDDFGTGYSSLAYLHDLPVSYLKIDRAFTARLLEDARTATIVSATIDMAHRLDLRVVAEGVETEEQLAWLAEHGCDLIQGYHTGRPMTVEAVDAWLAGHALVPQQFLP
jgi:diguanylate cyclase (GGDEF)-like protein